MTNMEAQGANNSSDFVRKLYKMLESGQDENVVRWGNDGDSFVVLENERFTKQILPKHFKHSNFASFVRQLNKYDFHKVRHNNEEGGSGASPYGPGAWEFRHPDFKVNNKDALDNIRRKAPAPRKSNTAAEEAPSATHQMDLVNTQLVATQQQFQALQDRHNELSMHHAVLQQTVANHEHVLGFVLNFLNTVDAQRRRESRVQNPFASATAGTNGTATPPTDPRSLPPVEEESPASPLQAASKLLEQMKEQQSHAGRHTTPHMADGHPRSAASSTSVSYSDLDMVYPVGQTPATAIDPLYSEHINNIPYPMPTNAPPATDSTLPAERKKSVADMNWMRSPDVLLVEDDAVCRRIGGKFLHSFQCSVDYAMDGLEAVNKLNSGGKYDLVLMDIVLPNLDGVSATHLIRQFDSTPIVAMTSNIRNEDVQMYFTHGMQDVLPKPFTRMGLLGIIDKYLTHLRQHHTVSTSPMNPPSKRSVKTEDSPASPATTATNWQSPSAFSGVSPQSNHTDEPQSYYSAGAYSTPGIQPAPPLYHAASRPVPVPSHLPLLPETSARRGISDVSGPAEMSAAKRQQPYAHSRSISRSSMDPTHSR